jgi:hypothetical protein
MEQHNISNITENVQNIENKNLFVHILEPEFLPIETVYVSISKLNEIPNSDIGNIFIGDTLDYIDYSEAANILDLVSEKMSTNNALIVQGADLFQLAVAISCHEIDEETAKEILYKHKKSIYNIYDIESELVNRKFKIVEKKYINIFEYYIKALKYE